METKKSRNFFRRKKYFAALRLKRMFQNAFLQKKICGYGKETKQVDDNNAKNKIIYYLFFNFDK